MKQGERHIIEESILKITNELLSEWEERLKKSSVYTDVSSIRRNNSESYYFSEIEVNFWNEKTLATTFSIIIYMENKQVLDIDEARDFIQEEIEVCYNECLLVL